MNIDRGKKIFQLKFIKISYRNRGYVPRTQIKEIEIKIIIIILMRYLIGAKNIIVVIDLRINILRYSDKKIKANQPPIYSTLKPDTNSDSPSAKSKGLRLVSAKHEDSHIKNNIILPQKNCNIFWDSSIWVNEYDCEIKATNKIIMKKETS